MRRHRKTLTFKCGPERRDALVVDDDSAVSAIVSAALERAGYTVRVARNCVSARHEMKRRAPHVLVIDIGLPDGNGLDIVRGLRPQSQGGPAVVVLSGLRQERNVLAAFDAGADDFMVKPFSPEELVARVKREMAE